MTKTWLQYLLFVGAYIVTFLFLDAIPIEVDFTLGIAIGAIGMLLVFIYMTRKKDFNKDGFYMVNLIFVVLFCGLTIIYDKIFGLTETYSMGNSIYFTNSKFYEWTLSVNHAIIISTIFLLVYSLFTKTWKSSLVVISTIFGLFIYFWTIV